MIYVSVEGFSSDMVMFTGGDIRSVDPRHIFQQQQQPQPHHHQQEEQQKKKKGKKGGKRGGGEGRGWRWRDGSTAETPEGKRPRKW